MAGGLFHYKHDPSPDRAYSINKEDYPRLPLFDPNAPAPKRRYLNEVFLLVLDNIPTWRSMSATYAVDSEAQMQTLAASDFPAIPASPSGPACMAIPKLSKTLVSYIVGLMVTTPYYRGNCDDRIKGLAEQYVKSCLATLNTIDGKAYKAFLQGRVTAWYALYPEMRPAPKARSSSVGSEEEEEAKDSGEEGQIGGSAPDLE